MKKASYIAVALIITGVIILSGCKKDDDFVPQEPLAEDTTTVTLKIAAKVRNENFALNNVYYDVTAHRYKVQQLNIYLSNITLIKADGTEHLVKDLALLRWDNTFLGETEDVLLHVDSGNYTGIRFWIGLDSLQNASDPAIFARDEPLSLYQGTYWDWNTGYRFVMLEGIYDTVPNGTGDIPSINTFQYHTGLNSLYREARLENAQQSFTVPFNGNTDYTLVMDVNKFLYNDTDTLRLKNESFTHTVGSYSLAERITENVTRSFSLQ